MIQPPSIFDYVKEEETRFDTEEIRVGDNWNWQMKTHVQLIFHLKNSQFFTGINDMLAGHIRVFKNIMEPILNLSYWAEDIELKDVVFFIENKNGRVLSFLVKKYHDEVFVKEHNLDTLFDEITEDDLDYGGVLVQKTNTAKPEVLFLPSIAFCDQTDILGGPMGFKFNFAPDKLRAMASRGWGNTANGATISIDELILLAQSEKEPPGMIGGKKNRTTGKNIEVYIVRGSLPEHYLNDNENMDEYYNQIHIVGFYKNEKSERIGVTLYRKKENESTLKFHTCKKVYGRALGRGVGEGILHPQVWTNFLETHKMKLLESASKVPLFTDDEGYTKRQKIQDMENLEITTIKSDSKYGIRQVPTAAPANIQLFERSVNEWYEQAQLTGSAFDPLLGQESPSGTTFRGQERSIIQGRGLHERRRGQRAKFIEEIYRDWIIPDIKKKILKGKKFLASMTSEEMSWLSDSLATNHADRRRIEAVLEGRIPEDKELLRQQFLADFSKKGNKHLLEILKGEFEDVELKMGITIGKKQKDLAMMSDKILSIFQFIASNPQGFQQLMQMPGMEQSFNDILEFSNISPVNFAAFSGQGLSPALSSTIPAGAPTNTTPSTPRLQLTAPVA